MWCFFDENRVFRRDEAAVFRPQNSAGHPVASYWHAAPPWFGHPESDREIRRRRFRSPEAAMRHADTTWPDTGPSQLPCAGGCA